MKDGHFNIQIVANITGLSVHTLRAWEKRYQAITPARLDNGRRIYAQEDIHKLKMLQKLCSLGHNIGTIANKDTKELEELISKFGINENEQSSQINFQPQPEKAKKTLSHILLALEANKLDIVSHEFYNLKMTVPPRDLALNLISPLMGKVGEMVMEGRLTIAQEHVLSSIIKFHMGKFIYRSYEEKRIKDQELVIITTPDSEYHEFGILMSALLCIHHNKPFFYLGPSMPAKALAEVANDLKATEILVGTTLYTYDGEKSVLTQYLKEVQNNIKSSTELVLGGNGVYDVSYFQSLKNFTHLPSLIHLDHHLEKK